MFSILLRHAPGSASVNVIVSRAKVEGNRPYPDELQSKKLKKMYLIYKVRKLI